MESGKREKHFAHPVRRKILRIGMVVVLSLLFLEFILYFGSNIFLKSYAQRKINEATQDVYIIDFNRFSFSLIRRGFFLDGIVLRPVHPENRKLDQTLFDATLDQIAFRSLWFDVFDRKFTIGKIYIDNPTINLDLPATFPGVGSPADTVGIGGEKISPIKALEAEIKKTVQRANLTGLFIKEVEIDHANFFFSNFLSKAEMKADNTSLTVRNIDFSTKEEWKTPFNAEGFEFELEQVIYPLPDSIHTIKADRVYISSLDNLVEIDVLDLTPDLTKLSRIYYQVQLKELRVGNVDLNKAFMTSILDVDELILVQPDLKVLSNTDVESDSAASGNLNDFIKGNLKSVSIKELSLNKGKFVRSELADTLKNRIELDELDFKMVGFYLGDDPVRRENQFFYGEDAAMEITNSRVYLGDQVHLIRGDHVSVSSFRDELIVRNLSIQPRSEALSTENPEKLIKLDLPEFSINKVGLKRLYNEGVLQAEQIKIVRPEVEFTELERSAQQKVDQIALAEIVGDFLNEVAVETFEVEDGTIQFKDARGERSNTIGFEKFSFRLDNVLFQPEISGMIQEQFQLDEVFLTLDKYRLKLKDNLHVILADQLTIDSKKQLLEVKNLTIRPENTEQIQTVLDTYGKTAVVDFMVPVFRAEGIDIKAAFYEERLSVHRILMPNPVFLISNHREKIQPEDGQAVSDTPSSNDEVRDLLLGYFKAIAVDSVSLDKAQVTYQSFVQDKQSTFEEDNFSLNLKNFRLDQELLIPNDKTLFSDEIDLVFNNYSFSLGAEKYEVSTNKLHYNSLQQSIDIEDLVLKPNDNFPGRIQLGLKFPRVNFKGVDVEQFFFENRLDLDKLEIDHGHIEIAIDRNIATQAVAKKSPKPEDGRRKSLELVIIDTIQTNNSRLSINYQLDESAVNSIETDFELLIRHFRLDSAITASRNVSELYEDANLSLKEFRFAFPDSIHSLGFSKVEIGSLKEEVIFSDFYITAKDELGVPGTPVLDAKIDQVVLKHNQLAEIQETGIFDVRDLWLINPKLNLYLDSVKVKKDVKISRARSTTALVQSIVLGNFYVEDGELTLHYKERGPIPRLDFDGIAVEIKDLDLNLLGQEQSFDLKSLAEKNAQFGLKNYGLVTPDSLYKVDIGSVDFREGNLMLEDVYYRPVDGNYKLLRQLPYQADAITARVQAVRLNQIDLGSYLERKQIKANELIVEGPTLDIFRDKRHPIDSGALKPMPQVLMKNAEIDADLDSLKIRGGQVRYFEFAEKGLVPGMISFDRVNMEMAPFYLRKPDQEFPLDQLQLGIETFIMDSAQVNLDAVLYFKEEYPMDVNVSMNSFAFADINDFLSKTLFIKAVDGMVTDGRWNFTLDDEEARGEMEFGYTNLKIQFLDSLTLEQGQGKLKLYTFGANLFAKKSNPRVLSSKIARHKIYLERDKRKFVFSAWWRASLTGLRGTFGFGRVKIPKRRDKGGS
jgi:hypothetical protein